MNYNDFKKQICVVCECIIKEGIAITSRGIEPYEVIIPTIKGMKVSVRAENIFSTKYMAEITINGKWFIVSITDNDEIILQENLVNGDIIYHIDGCKYFPSRKLKKLLTI